MYYSLSAEYWLPSGDTYREYRDYYLSTDERNEGANKDVSYIPFIYLGTIETENDYGCDENGEPVDEIDISNYYINTVIRDISWDKFVKLFYPIQQSVQRFFIPNYYDPSSCYYYNFNEYEMINKERNTRELYLYPQIITSYQKTAGTKQFPSIFYTILQRFYSTHANIFSLVNCNINNNIYTFQELQEYIIGLNDVEKDEFLVIITLIFYPPINYAGYNRKAFNTMTLNLNYRINHVIHDDSHDEGCNT